jgi:hypothetical protein
MKLQDFTIGSDFLMSGKRYRCTDIGSRVVVAIEIRGMEITAFEDGIKTTRHLTCEEAEAEGWFRGPSYAVIEHVIDENDQPVCEPVQ